MQLNTNSIHGDYPPSYILNIPILYHNYPDAKFVHNVRDCLDVVLSQGKFRFRKYISDIGEEKTVALWNIFCSEML